MDPTPCQSLDDYLAQDLGAEERARFVAHLAGCPDCRRAVRDAERLRALFTAAVAQLEPVPAGLTERVRRQLRAVRRRRLAVTVTALAAAAAAVWLIGPIAHRQVKPVPQGGDVSPPAAVQITPQPTQQVRVRFPAGTAVVTVPAPTDSPHVTFVWVYPGLRAAPPRAPTVAAPPPSQRSKP